MKDLVAYFSATGITKDIAKTLADVANADIYEILPKEPYSVADLDWNDENSRTSKECKDKSSRPKIAQSIDISPYGRIFVGFPIWWYHAPHIINTFLESHNFHSKIIIPYCTSGGSELETCRKFLKDSAPKAVFQQDKKFDFGSSRGSIRKWLESLEQDKK